MGRAKEKNNRKIIYIVIFILLIIIIASIYFYMRKGTEKSKTEYDVIAELMFSKGIDYKSILDEYESKYNDELEHIEYKVIGLSALVEPSDVLMSDLGVREKYENGKEAINTTIYGLDENSYKNYINTLNANYGDIIIYNFERDEMNEADKNIDFQVFQTDKDFKLSFVSFNNQTFNDYNELGNYIENTTDEMLYSVDTTVNISITKSEVYDSESLDGKYILTDKLPEGFSEVKIKNYCTPTIFVNMDKFNEIKTRKDERKSKKQDVFPWWQDDDSTFVKIKSGKIKKLSEYINKIKEEKNVDIILTTY